MSKNTQIPEKAIDRKAKIGDNETIIVAINPLFICEPEVTKTTNANTKMITKNAERILSTELVEGMTIKAVESGTTQNRRRAAQKIENANSKDIEQDK